MRGKHESKQKSVLETEARVMRSYAARAKTALGRGRLADVAIRALLFAFLALVQSAAALASTGARLTWGVNAINLKRPCADSISLDGFLADDTNTVLLNNFFRAGGEDVPATPTECRIGYNRDNLLVLFRCREQDMSFPTIQRRANWNLLLGSPAEQDSAFPDKVDLFIQPDVNAMANYHFTATFDGLKFGAKRRSGSDVTNGAPESTEELATNGRSSTARIDGFSATVLRRANEWVAFFEIPWKTLGGKPRSDFGLLPVRTRWRDGEVSSPVAFDFTERPAVDLFIETSFATNAPVPAPDSVLYQLPSGTLRWQRPALLSYPDAETVRQIWQMELSLSNSTETNNLAQRLYLTQRWIDLLTLEGFNFRTGTGSIAEKGMEPFIVRREINAALRSRKMPLACQFLDAFLHELDRTSRDWFADGSPGDILSEEWKPLSMVQGMEAKDNVLRLRGSAGDHPVDLHVSLPETGGVRVYGNDEGYFKPANLLPLNILRSSNSCSIQTANGKIVVSQAPFAIVLYDAAGSPVIHIGPGDIAFRFNAEGKVVAVDFKNHLDANEVIYGFGEKYDRFNENGNVLTLWGMDDWSGNTVGLMNQTYKPIPIFHSSRGYMVFDDSTYRLRGDIGKTRPDQYRLTQQGPVLDYYFWIGPPEKALQSYTGLTGKPVLPPRWAFKPWIGRTGRGWSQAPSRNPVTEEESVVKRFEELDIPHSAIYAEGSSADSAALNAFMAARGIKVLSWYYPAISKAKQATLMPELKPDELPILHSESGNAPWELVDFSNPNALELCRRWWKHRLDIGVAGSMVDFGDSVPEDAVFFSGQRGEEMHNFYSYGYQRTYGEVFREKRGDDFILFGRAAAPGTQKWVAQFAGDHPANFAGLQSVLTGALNLCACGFSTWGSDLGGFLGWPEPEVYMRWTQFACFSPLMRCHGRTPREPWEYGAAAVANYKRYAWVRENLLDYIYNAAVDAHKTGIPMMRSMAVAYPGEASLANVKDQYMFGADLLVAPVVSQGVWRPVSFPPGRWISLWYDSAVTGPVPAYAVAPPDMIPVYLKAGALMPVRLNKELQFGASMTRGRVDALLATPPTENQTVSWSDVEGNSFQALTKPTANGFVLILRNLSELRYLLLYDAKIKSVKVDGEDLPNVAQAEIVSMPAGWRVDSNRVVVHLSVSAASRNKAAREIEVEFAADRKRE